MTFEHSRKQQKCGLHGRYDRLLFKAANYEKNSGAEGNGESKQISDSSHISRTPRKKITSTSTPKSKITPKTPRKSKKRNKSCKNKSLDEGSQVKKGDIRNFLNFETNNSQHNSKERGQRKL